jgi:RNA polymerase sigma-70 factor (ECF subfamily)
MQNAPVSPDDPLPDAARADQGLLAAARSGAIGAFAQLIRQHQANVFTLALRFTGNRADAEELAQDTFLEMHEALSQFSSPLHLRHWLLRTVSHRSLNMLRQRGRRPQLISLDIAVEVATDPAAMPEADHLAASRLHALLLQLAPDARAVMLLRLQEDLDPSDIATVLAMPLNTVKSHLRRSLDWLRTQYAGDEHGI